VLIYSSCKKDSAVDLTPSFYFVNGDTTASTFNNNLVLFGSSDSAVIKVYLSSTYLVSENVDVTVAADADAVTAYNASHGTNFQPMPSSAYSFPTTVTATTNSIYDTITVTIFKHALSAGTDYMLPINVINAGGVDITLGPSVIYLHTISNKLSGIYTSTIIKTMYNGDASDNNVSSIDTFTITKGLIPVSSGRSELDYADLGSNGWKYILFFFTDIPGDPPTFTVSVNDVIASSVQSGSFKILSSSYDPITNDIYIKSSYKNTSGNERIIGESLKLQ
jgi:hypothetical protein